MKKMDDGEDTVNRLGAGTAAIATAAIPILGTVLAIVLVRDDKSTHISS